VARPQHPIIHLPDCPLRFHCRRLHPVHQQPHLPYRCRHRLKALPAYPFHLSAIPSPARCSTCRRRRRRPSPPPGLKLHLRLLLPPALIALRTRVYLCLRSARYLPVSRSSSSVPLLLLRHQLCLVKLLQITLTGLLIHLRRIIFHRCQRKTILYTKTKAPINMMKNRLSNSCKR